MPNRPLRAAGRGASQFSDIIQSVFRGKIQDAKPKFRGVFILHLFWPCFSLIFNQNGEKNHSACKGCFFVAKRLNPWKRREQGLRSARAPNSTETQKEVKWVTSDSKMTPRVPPQSDLRWPQNNSNMGSRVTFEAILGHFGVGLPEPLLSHSWVTLILPVSLSS